MPKATKNTNTATSASSVDTIKQEWLTVVKDITEATEKLDQLCKRRDELVSQLWTHLNKDPASTVVDGEDKVPEKAPAKKAPAKKGATSAPTEDEDELASAKTPAPAKKAPAKKGATSAPTEDEDDLASAKTPAPAKKAPAKKGGKVATAPADEAEELAPAKSPAKAPAKKGSKLAANTAAKPADDDEEESAEAKTPAKTPAKAPAKTTAKKTTAPAKGTPKPKLDVDSEDVNLTEDPSSEETDLDSLSSVSSESDASGGEDN